MGISGATEESKRRRARILVLAAEGHSNTEIGRRAGVSLPTVRMWRER